VRTGKKAAGKRSLRSLEVLVLAIAAIATAWTGHQAARAIASTRCSMRRTFCDFIPPWNAAIFSIRALSGCARALPRRQRSLECSSGGCEPCRQVRVGTCRSPVRRAGELADGSHGWEGHHPVGWNWPDELAGEVASAAIVAPSRRPRSQVPGGRRIAFWSARRVDPHASSERWRDGRLAHEALETGGRGATSSSLTPATMNADSTAVSCARPQLADACTSIWIVREAASRVPRTSL
jgi:hypothetical protein